VEEDPKPNYKLFSIGQVLFATAFGTSIAGGLLLAINYSRLKRGRLAVWSVILLCVVPVIIQVVYVFLHHTFLLSLSWPIMVGVMFWFAVILQGHDLHLHFKNGDLKDSYAVVVGILLLDLVTFAVVFFAVLFTMEFLVEHGVISEPPPPALF
jgi:hypothetical protein